MKYLDFKLYEKLCCVEPDENDIILWEKRYYEWLSVLKRHQRRYPKEFMSEFNKKHFHDYTIQKIELINEISATLTLKLTLFHNNIIHELKFYNLTEFKTDISILYFPNCDWIIAELSPLPQKRNLFDILLSDGELSFNFEKMDYQKKTKGNTQGESAQ